MKVSFAFLFTLLVVTSAQELRGNGGEDGVDEIQDVAAEKAMRIAFLEEAIEGKRQLLKDHKAGRRRLSDEEFAKITARISNTERKLETVKNTGLEEYRTRRMTHVNREKKPVNKDWFKNLK
jgi:hypothetical protein